MERLPLPKVHAHRREAKGDGGTGYPHDDDEASEDDDDDGDDNGIEKVHTHC